MKKLSKKIIVSVLVIAFVFSPAFAPKAEAQYVDIVQSVKDMGLDGIAWIVANMAISRMAASTVNWINSGFEGRPAYVTDPSAYFLEMADNLAAQYIFSNPDLNLLCGPINARIRLALAKNYRNERQWQCTLEDVVGNVEDFMDDFSKGGWDGFFELTQRQQNNPIGAFLQAENELNIQIASRQGIKKSELDWGQGFMSWEECTEVPSEFFDANGMLPPTERCETKTPGSVISEQLNKQLGLGGGKLQVADEINEIVSALFNQLIGKVVGGLGSLRGTSGPSSTSNSSGSLIDQLIAESEGSGANITDYFGNKQDTTILDKPLPEPPDPNEPIKVQIVGPSSSSGESTTGGTTGGTTEETTDSFITVSADVLNIRSAPNTTSAILGQMSVGQTFQANCYAVGEDVEGTSFWWQTVSGGYVTASGTDGNVASYSQCP